MLSFAKSSRSEAERGFGRKPSSGSCMKFRVFTQLILNLSHTRPIRKAQHCIKLSEISTFLFLPLCFFVLLSFFDHEVSEILYNVSASSEVRSIWVKRSGTRYAVLSDVKLISRLFAYNCRFKKLFLKFRHGQNLVIAISFIFGNNN